MQKNPCIYRDASDVILHLNKYTVTKDRSMIMSNLVLSKE